MATKVPPPPITAFWRSSRASNEGACIRITGTSEYVWLRDSKHPRGPILGFTREGWLAFLDVVQRNGFGSGSGFPAVPS